MHYSIKKKTLEFQPKNQNKSIFSSIAKDHHDLY